MNQIKYINLIIVFMLIAGLGLFASCKHINPIKTEKTNKSDETKIKADEEAQNNESNSEVQEASKPDETTDDSKPETAIAQSYINLVDGTNFSFNDVKDHVLIIDFWAPWCPPCKAEIPGFIDLHTKYKDKKFAIIGISVSTTEKDVKAFIKQAKVNYPIIMGTSELVAEYEVAMGQNITAIPTTLVINRKGEIASVHVGAEDKSVFEQEILKLF